MSNSDNNNVTISTDATTSTLKAWFSCLSAEKLTNILMEICGDYPDIARDLIHRSKLEKGDSSGLLSDITLEADSLASIRDPGDNYYHRYDDVPDYEALLKKVRQALSFGITTELLPIFEKLLEGVQEQVQIFDENGEFCMEVEECYTVAAEVLELATIESAEKILWAIERILADEYDIAESLSKYLEKDHPTDSWSEVANELLMRLSELEKPTSGHDYYRDQLSNFAILSLQKSGRNSEIIPLCEREVNQTMSYVRLVSNLLKENRVSEAEQYIVKGVSETYDKYPGISSQLQTMRVELHSTRKQFDLVQAHYICRFVDSPSEQSYLAVKTASDKLKCWQSVRNLIWEYLQNGVLPWEQADWVWVKPDQTQLAGIRPNKNFPMARVLIHLSILENNPAQVIDWYKRLPKDTRFNNMTCQAIDLEVAKAVSGYDPELSLSIWKRKVAEEIAVTKPHAYCLARTYLKEISALMTRLNRNKDWQVYLGQLRNEHKRKRLLIKEIEDL
jgi:uncharacterized Zn finger protein